MKLNLLPTSISKEGQQKTAMIVSILVAVLGILGCLALIFTSRNSLQAAKDRAQSLVGPAAEAVSIASEADAIIQGGTGIQRNSWLAAAMLAHNSVYPNLYREVLDYVPAFYRVTSLTAAPVSESECAVTMTGVLQSYEQYANIMLALLRIPTATNVTRAGFQNVGRYVPNLDAADQIGIPIRPGEARLPSNPLQRLDQMIANAAAAPQGFQNVSGFGTSDGSAKGPMPDWSQVTLTVTLRSGDVNGKVISRDIRTPDPRATLALQTGAPATAAPPAAPQTPGGPTKGAAAPGGGGPIRGGDEQ